MPKSHVPSSSTRQQDVQMKASAARDTRCDAIPSNCVARGRSPLRGGGTTQREMSTPVKGEDEELKLRSRSEPPHRAVEVFDDPFEPPPQLECWALPVSLHESSMSVSHGFEANFSKVFLPSWCESPKGPGGSSIASTRVPSCGAATPKNRGRAQSLTRSLGFEHSHEIRIQIAEAGDIAELRCKSEPPNQHMDDAFDNNVEPPLQSLSLTSHEWERELSMVETRGFNSGWTPYVGCKPWQSLPIVSQTAPVLAKNGDIRGTCVALGAATPMPVYDSFVAKPAAGAPRASMCRTRTPSCGGRGRPVTIWEDEEHRLQSRSVPPCYRMIEVFDDPFEPPPQDGHWALPTWRNGSKVAVMDGPDLQKTMSSSGKLGSSLPDPPCDPWSRSMPVINSPSVFTQSFASPAIDVQSLDHAANACDGAWSAYIVAPAHSAGAGA